MQIVDEKKCTGCGVCSLVCPKDCIKMSEDKEGFRRPVVDVSKCVNCGLCQKKCPVLNEYSSPITLAIAAKNSNEEIRNKSTSGGVFYEAARAVLSNGGVVCAAKYDEQFSVGHTFAYTMDEVVSMMGAKYAQSKAEHCFSAIKCHLKEGKPILFVGTPCQTAALGEYLGQDYENLYLVDLICHGVPSPKVWQKYLQSRQMKDAPDQAIVDVNLRSKETGWSKYSYAVEMTYNDGAKYLVRQGEDLYIQGFVQNLFLRQSCSQCSFKGDFRRSDMTLGDFWGVWDLYPEFDDNKGVSLLLIRSKKGLKLWEKMRGCFDSMEVSADAALRYNSSALVSSVPHVNRNKFFEVCLSTDSMEACIKSNLLQDVKKISWLRRLASKIKRLLRK